MTLEEDFKNSTLVGTGNVKQILAPNSRVILAHRVCTKGFLPEMQEEKVQWTKELWRCTACKRGFAASHHVLIGEVGCIIVG